MQRMGIDVLTPAVDRTLRAGGAGDAAARLAPPAAPADAGQRRRVHDQPDWRRRHRRRRDDPVLPRRQLHALHRARNSQPAAARMSSCPGQPAHAVVSWEAPGASLRFDLLPGVDNLLLFDAVSVRAAIDPLSPLNAAGAPQAFSVRLTDRQGNSADRAGATRRTGATLPRGRTGRDSSSTHPSLPAGRRCCRCASRSASLPG